MVWRVSSVHTLNNDGHLEENNKMGRIYPQELKLDQEKQNDDKATFLDLEEQIKDACIEVKTYDKRDIFKFEIIDYADLSGNIPTKPVYGVFTSQVIRYARICSKKDDLIESVKSLTKKPLWKHYTISGFRSSLKKYLEKPRWITTKLGPRPGLGPEYLVLVLVVLEYLISVLVLVLLKNEVLVLVLAMKVLSTRTSTRRVPIIKEWLIVLQCGLLLLHIYLKI